MKRSVKQIATVAGAALTGVVIAACASTMGGAGHSTSTVQPADHQYARFDANNQLIRPTDYRTWVFVGTPLTPNDLNNGMAAFPEFHNVYLDPASYEHYKRTGEWREGTILVKELVSVGDKQASSGNGYFMGEYIGLEATVKSAKHFPNEPGNWAYFRYTDEEAARQGRLGNLALKAAALPTNACNQCHQGNAGDDFVFTQYYPTLRAAKGFGAGAPENTPRDRGMGRRGAAGGMMGTVASDTLTFDQSGREPHWRASEPTPSSVNGTEVPTEQQALFNYLRSFAYRDWEAKETASHPGRGPHTQIGSPVRVYMNDTLAASMTQGRAEHPVGATAVKEMYERDGKLIGWAVETKTQSDSNLGKGWFWYEVTSTTDGSEPVAIGNGVQGCVGCHAPGNDYVLSARPR